MRINRNNLQWEEAKENENKLGFLNLMVIVLSLYVLVTLLIGTFLVLPKETEHLLNYIDNSICIFF
ncbi:MAG: hypothetical protein ACXVNM_01630, partial [Bacteroidia bacterium]